MEDTLPKNYPAATPEISKMFNLDKPEDVSAESMVSQNRGHLPGALPVVDVEAEQPHMESPKQARSEHIDREIENDIASTKGFSMPAILKNTLPYLVVFAAGIFLYFFFFSKVDFSGLFKAKQTTVQTPKQSVLAQLEQQNLASYQTWIAGFYYDVSDSKVTDPEADNSGNGLTNFQKYLLNLNPKSYDTLGLGRADSQTLALGLNPLTGSPLTDNQKQLLDKYFDMELVMNRLTLNRLQNPSQVAGASTFSNGSMNDNFGFSAQSAQANVSGSNNNYNYNINNSNSAYAPEANSMGINSIEVDQNVPGRLQVPSLKIDAPILWSSDPKNFDKDLQSGVVHYPGTALPGQIGTAYISGHSSNYIWAKGNYNHIFTYLGNLADNASFQVTVTQKNGKQAILHYVVTGRQEYAPDDIAQFQNRGDSTVALSTCWPVGSTAKRLVVFGKVTQIEK